MIGGVGGRSSASLSDTWMVGMGSTKEKEETMRLVLYVATDLFVSCLSISLLSLCYLSLYLSSLSASLSESLFFLSLSPSLLSLYL